MKSRDQGHVRPGFAEPVDARRKSSAECLRFIAASMLSEPLCTGRCKNGISCGLSRCARVSSSSCRSGGGRVTQPLRFGISVRRQQAPQAPCFSVRPLAVIGIHVLAEQDNFARASSNHTSASANTCRRGPRIFRAARVRHDAERAEFVAAFLDRQIGDDCSLQCPVNSAGSRIWVSVGNSASITEPRVRRACAMISGKR